MPTYEYECQQCKATYELQQSFSAESTHTCEKCGKGTAKRVIHAPRVVFKGSGWYVTDSRNASSAVTGSSDNGSGSGESSSSSSSSESAGGEATAAAG